MYNVYTMLQYHGNCLMWFGVYLGYTCTPHQTSNC